MHTVGVLWDPKETSQLKYPFALKARQENKGMAFFDLGVFNGKANIGVNIISDDGHFIRTIYIAPESIGLSGDDIERAGSAVGSKISGQYPLDKITIEKLKDVVNLWPQEPAKEGSEG
jgi:hypothetical protein